MKIVIMTLGSRGDVQPYVALGEALRDAGYEVSIATHGLFEDLVTQRRLDFRSVHGNPKEVLKSEQGRRWLESGRNSLAFLTGLKGVARDILEPSSRQLWQAADGADAILASRLAVGAAVHIAERLEVPLVPSYLQPFTPTGEFPPIYISTWDMGGRLNLISHHFSDWIFWRTFHEWTHTFRTEVLGLSAMTVKELRARLRSYPTLYGFSPSVVPKPRDWKADDIVAGFWFLDRKTDWKPTRELETFLSSGPPPVCVGFGSMANRRGADVTSLFIECLRRSGHRGIFLTGWDGLEVVGPGVDLFFTEEIPHDWLFPRVAAVIHHGGVGTTAAALRACVPMVTIPFFADQFFWGLRAFGLGVGAKPIPRDQLSVERVVAALQSVATDSQTKQNAQALGHRIQSENGLHKAVELIDWQMSRNDSGPAQGRFSDASVLS